MAKQLYSLFHRADDGKHWVRVSAQAYTLPVARRVYQDRLIYGLCGMGDDFCNKEHRLRPIGTQRVEPWEV